MRRALVRGFLTLASAMVVSCGLSSAGTGADDADAGAPPPPDASGAVIEDTGSAATTDAGADGGGCVPAPANLVAWWPGEGNMLDVAGTNPGVAGTQNGASGMAYAPGEVGQAFDLGGKSYVQVKNSATLTFAQALTAEAWIFATALGGRIVDKNTAGGSDGFLLDTYQSKLRFITGATLLSSTTTLPTNAWVHVAGTWDGTTMRVYANAVLVGSTLSNKLPMNALALRIGADSNGQNHFSGKIDEVAVYSRALSQGEISGIFGAGMYGRCR